MNTRRTLNIVAQCLPSDEKYEKQCPFTSDCCTRVYFLVYSQSHPHYFTPTSLLVRLHLHPGVFIYNHFLVHLHPHHCLITYIHILACSLNLHRDIHLQPIRCSFTFTSLLVRLHPHACELIYIHTLVHLHSHSYLII